MDFIGELLDTRYKIVRQLSEGNFGETYLARDHKRPSKPLCVVKRLKPKHTHPRVMELFEQEAIILEKLGEHPQIPRLLAHFAVDNDLFIIQDYVAGHTLRKEIAPRKQMAEADVKELLHDILEVLVFVHQNNVIHRDIKPENVMRRKHDGKIVLIDFGSVRELGTISIDIYKMIRTSVVVGTPGYIPTEQAKGKPRLCSDIYALGMMAIEALTGVSPHLLQEDPETGKLMWREDVQVSDAFADVLETMICDRYTLRYPSASETLQALTATQNLPFFSRPILPQEPKAPAEPQISLEPELATVILPLEEFEFELANIAEKRWFGSKPTYDINRLSATAQCFIEDLNDGLTLTMVSIPGRQFLMGSPDDEPERFDTESPQHSVNVQPFFISKFPITQAQWQAVATLPAINRTLEPEPASVKGANRPVEQVSWEDAVEFCARLGEKTKRKYRLPSEAEWEYACRANTTTPFHFGETLIPSLANYNNSSLYSTDQGNHWQTTIVGSFPANAFGLYDMHGNVWEWCGDHWHENYQGAPIDGSVWLSTDDYKSRVIRGGSWKNSSRLCRSAYRSWNPQDGRGNLLGFRVVISLSGFQLSL
ncbi:bifunctional serine/threonine-protein kinase/formylglycine-generating enzyme family protein [Nostoc sp. CHAB 5844]|nr:bifunctional serine/threonine-protein kinase/formylglycine-generating enzyme family protein [Nostoc sp. CHAB 5844]